MVVLFSVFPLIEKTVNRGGPPCMLVYTASDFRDNNIRVRFAYAFYVPIYNMNYHNMYSVMCVHGKCIEKCKMIISHWPVHIILLCIDNRLACTRFICMHINWVVRKQVMHDLMKSLMPKVKANNTKFQEVAVTHLVLEYFSKIFSLILFLKKNHRINWFSRYLSINILFYFSFCS